MPLGVGSEQNTGASSSTQLRNVRYPTILREREETAVTVNSPPQHLMITQLHANDMELTMHLEWKG